jgi:tetratricopeptide (TPR) repeat protein
MSIRKFRILSRFHVFVLLLLSILPVQVFPQSTPCFYGDFRADFLIRKGLQLSYNLEYAPANKVWDELIQLYPEHPAGYVYKSALTWWQAVEDRENKSLERQFNLQTQMAINKGTAWIEANPRDKIALAYLASAYVNRTRFDATVTRSYLSALRNGKRAHKYIEMAHAVDLKFYDAYVGMGSYNYFTGALPAVIKPFAWLLGARGDKNEGIEQLKLAMEKGEYAQTEAKIVMLGVYVSERRWDDYQELLDSLMKEYPLNHVFYYWGANFYLMMQRWDAGIISFKNIEKLIDPSQSDYAGASYAWLQYNLARNYFAKQDWHNALESLNHAERGQTRNPVLLVQLFLLKGNTLDVLGRRGEAVACYEKVLEYSSIEDSATKAKRYLKSAYGRGSP